MELLGPSTWSIPQGLPVSQQLSLCYCQLHLSLQSVTDKCNFLSDDLETNGICPYGQPLSVKVTADSHICSTSQIPVYGLLACFDFMYENFFSSAKNHPLLQSTVYHKYQCARFCVPGLKGNGKLKYSFYSCYFRNTPVIDKKKTKYNRSVACALLCTQVIHSLINWSSTCPKCTMCYRS